MGGADGFEARAGSGGTDEEGMQRFTFRHQASGPEAWAVALPLEARGPVGAGRRRKTPKLS